MMGSDPRVKVLALKMVVFCFFPLYSSSSLVGGCRLTISELAYMKQ